MKRRAAVIEAAQYLSEAERAVDCAYGQLATLANRLFQLQGEVGIAGSVTHPAIAAVTAALASASSMRGDLLKAHSELVNVKAKIGCRSVATGGHECPDEIVAINEGSEGEFLTQVA